MRSIFAVIGIIAFTGVSRAQPSGDSAYVAIHAALTPNKPSAFISLFLDSAPLEIWLDDSIPALDSLREPNWVSVTSSSSVVNYYSDLLSTVEWGRLEFTTAEQRKFDTLISKLYTQNEHDKTWNPSVQLDGYLKVRNAYEKLLAIWQATPVELRTSQQEDELKRSKLNFDEYPNGQSIRSDLRGIRTLYNYDYARFGRRARVRFNPDTNARTPSRPTEVTPTVANIHDLQFKQVRATDTGIVRQIPYGYAINLSRWRVNGAEADVNRAVFSISFEYSIVSVQRDWLDYDAFFQAGLRVWRAKPGLVVSAGIMPARPPASLDFTFVPSELVVARRICLSGKWSADGAEKLKLLVRSGVEIRYGPFQLSGPLRSGGVIVPEQYEAGTLCIPGYQVIGSMGSLTPASPTARTDLLWGQGLPALPGLD